MKRILILFALVVFVATAQAETFTWNCNPESDMKEYRGERSSTAGASWGVLFTAPHVPGCATLSYQNKDYVAPGQKLARLFAIDKSGNVSRPSETVPYTIATSPIGNPGGQSEPSLPPSPYVVAQNPPPPVSPPPASPPPASPPPTPPPGCI